MLEKIKIRLNIYDNEKDYLILDLIEDCFQELKDLTNNNDLELDKTTEPIIKEMVSIKYNALGSEGLSSESMNGHSQSFLSDLPAPLKRKILNLRKIRR